MDQVWQIMGEHLHFIHHAFEVKIYAFLLMNNHFHLILRTPESNLSEAMGWFMRESSRALTRAGNRINQTYGGRHFRSVMESHHYYLNAYKYLYHNPIHAGICDNVLDYPYSTLPGLLGQTKLLIPVEEDVTLFSDPEGTVDWLNRKVERKNWESMRRALKRDKFKLAQIQGRPHPLENDAL